MNTDNSAAEEREQTATCGECGHTFRRKISHETVICVPHLKPMPTDHCEVCELHRPKDRKQ